MESDSRLVNRSVVVCRAEGDARYLSAAIADFGGQPIAVPLLKVLAPPDGGVALRLAVANLAAYGWVAVTSANGARALLAALGELVGGSWPSETKIAVVGKATESVFVEAGLRVDFVSPRSTAADLAALMPDPLFAGEAVLCPLAELASGDLAEGLTARGFGADLVVAYATELPPVSDAERGLVVSADAVLLTAPSVAERFKAAIGLASVPKVVVCIGPKTAAAAAALGFEVSAVAVDQTDAGLVLALVDCFDGH